MDNSFPRAVSGSGFDISERIHKPLLSASSNFDRVSSYFGPKSLALVIDELSEIWKLGGKIRLILSPSDTSEIHEALENVVDDEVRIILSVEESIKKAIQKIKGSRPEIIEALEEMMISDLLQVAIVVPRTKDGIFHSKFSIYHISEHSEIGKKIESGVSRYVSVHGSFNETLSGYSHNIEDASTHRSWVPSEFEVAQVFKLRFDELWNDFAPDVISVPVTSVIRDELDLDKRTESNNYLRNMTIGSYLQRISMIPSSSGYDEAIWLMPHQISVVNSSLSYFPVRSMLCDEVGLGKTIQAGCIISRLFLENISNRAIVIAPAATLTQWAVEISQKFGIPTSVYRNQLRERYLNGELLEESRLNISSTPRNLLDNSPVTIISSQWFRLRNDEYVKELASNYELMILDEAHHARLDNWKKKSGTKLRKKIKILSELVPNVLLLTATPYQTGREDYLSLLDILQTVTEEDEEDLRIGHGVVSGKLHWNKNQQSALIRSLARRLELVKPNISSTLYDSIKSSAKPLGLKTLSRLIQDHEIDEKLLYSTLPTNISTFRNTRTMLRDLGMGFPEVIFKSIAVESGEYSEVLKKSENFIMKYLGGRNYASGLTRSLYYQRAISSISALHSTLNNRSLDVLNLEIEKAEYELDFSKIPPASAIEIERIELLVEEIEKVMAASPDPKILELNKLIDSLYKEGEKVLIFSRYTDTTRTIENELWKSFPNLSIGRYDGDFIRIREKNELAPIDVTKENLIKRLSLNEIDVIVCSDAASEGLNLQSASAVINVDVPWNPARVLQRIGRVDRLGQTSEIVKIFNLVYFGTIEERMYRVLDDRQTEAIRYLGEMPELLATEESRHLYQVFGVPITQRVDLVQSQTRGDVMLDRLSQATDHHESHINSWLNLLIEEHQNLDLNSNPASHQFVMRNPVVLNSLMDLNPGIDGILGYAICEEKIRHALVVKNEDRFIPISPSIILQSAYSSIEWMTLYDAVKQYTNDFDYVQRQDRSAGLMSSKFKNNQTSKIQYQFVEL